MIKYLVRWSMALLLVVIVAGCGGTGANNSATVSGVAAAGSVLVGNVYLKDSSVPAKRLYAPIAADGSFQFDLTELTAPFILKASGTVNGRPATLYSFTPAAGIANINPLSNLALVLASGRNDLANLYSSVSADEMRILANFMVNAVPTVQATLRPTLARFGAEAVNFISDPYKVNHQGLDLMLDMATISASSSVVTLFDKTSGNAVQANFADFRTRTIDFILNPTTKIGTVCIAPPSAVHPNESVALTAYVIGLDDQRVTWSVVEENGGSITVNGVYTAPAAVGTYHVTATSSVDPTRSMTAEITVRAASSGSIWMVSSGPGEYAVMASDFSNVGGVEVTISYDNNALSNPRITKGPMLATAMFIANPKYMPGSLKFAAMSLTPLAGSGTLAIISFDLLGTAPNPPVITSRKTSAVSPPTPPAGGGDTIPVPELPPPSAGGAIPSGSVQPHS